MLKRMTPAGKRKGSRQREEKLKATAADQGWSMDFVTDQLHDGTRFRSLTIMDVFTREAVAIDAGQSLKGQDVVQTLNRLTVAPRPGRRTCTEYGLCKVPAGSIRLHRAC